VFCSTHYRPFWRQFSQPITWPDLSNQSVGW